MHDHDHGGHGHAHGPDASRAENRRRLTIVLILATGYSVVEMTGGWLTASLALIADAFHLLSDVAALALSLFAVWMAQRPADARRTFGHSRAEILAALANGVGLAAIAAMICVGAIRRFDSPAEVDGLGVVAFAAGALAYELVSLWILSSGKSQNLNMRGAWLHIASDALGSIGAMVSGALIWAYGWYWADPVASLLISALVLRSGWWLIRDAVDVLMEGVPAHLDPDEIREALIELPGVAAVHDLHIWTIGSGEISLSCHIVAEPGGADPGLLPSVHAVLRERFALGHTTIQVENGDTAADTDCEAACDGDGLVASTARG
jgi:cobalt-zinc-cadmium efflux system protein